MFSDLDHVNPDFHGDEINDETFGASIDNNGVNKGFLDNEGELEAFDFEHFIGDPTVNKEGSKLEAELGLGGLEALEHHPNVAPSIKTGRSEQGMCVIGELERMLVSTEEVSLGNTANLQTSHPPHIGNLEPLSSDGNNIWATNFPSYPNFADPLPSQARQQEAFLPLLQGKPQSSLSQKTPPMPSGGMMTVNELENFWFAPKPCHSSVPSMHTLESLESQQGPHNVRVGGATLDNVQRMEAAFRKHVAAAAVTSSLSETQVPSDLKPMKPLEPDVISTLLHQLQLQKSLQSSTETSSKADGGEIPPTQEQNQASLMFMRREDRAMPSSTDRTVPSHPQPRSQQAQVWQMFFKDLQAAFFRIGDSYIKESCDFEKFKKDIMELYNVAVQRGTSLNIPSGYIDATFKKLSEAVGVHKQKMMQQKLLHSRPPPPQSGGSSSLVDSKTSSAPSQPLDDNATLQQLRLLLQQQQQQQHSQVTTNRVPYPGAPPPVASSQLPGKAGSLSRNVSSSNDQAQMLLQQQATLLSLFLLQQQQKGVQSLEGIELQRQLGIALSNLNVPRQMGPVAHHEQMQRPPSHFRSSAHPEQHGFHGSHGYKSDLPEWMEEDVESPCAAFHHQQIENGGWMQQHEKDWLLRIMTKQISCENPYRQDYYFTRQKLNHLMKQYHDDMRRLQHHGPPSLKATHPLSYLPSPVTADELMTGHDVIAASLSGHDVTNVEPIPYRPPGEQSENNLGRLTVSSCYTPRQLIDITTSALKQDSTNFTLESSDKEAVEVSSTHNYKSILMRIENLFVHVLQLDELTISLEKLVAQTKHRDIMEQYKEKLIHHLIKELQSKQCGLKHILTVRKGCALLLKFASYLEKEHLQELLILFFEAMNDALANEPVEFSASIAESAPLLLQVAAHFQRFSCKNMEVILRRCHSLPHLCLHSVPYTLAYELMDRFELSQKDDENIFSDMVQQWASMLITLPLARHARLLKSYRRLWLVMEDYLTAGQRKSLEQYVAANFSSTPGSVQFNEDGNLERASNDATIGSNSNCELSSLTAS